MNGLRRPPASPPLSGRCTTDTDDALRRHRQYTKKIIWSDRSVLYIIYVSADPRLFTVFVVFLFFFFFFQFSLVHSLSAAGVSLVSSPRAARPLGPRRLQLSDRPPPPPPSPPTPKSQPPPSPPSQSQPRETGRVMVLIKEYRICMPLTVEEYHVGQLYMISRHSYEQTENGEGVETIINAPCEDPVHGKGQFTEKRIHLSNRLPYWIQAIIPKVFYIIEKSWNYYPFTITEYTCSFIPKLSVTIHTKFEDNSGTTENCLGLTGEKLVERTVDFVDIAYDEVSPKHYREEEDLKFFQSKKTMRGPLPENWKNTTSPIMCSYKVVEASFEVWGIQSKAEEYIQKTIREILLLGHRQAFAWIDDWISMTIADVRTYECEMQRQTNTKVNACSSSDATAADQQTSPDGGLRSPKSMSPLANLFSSSSTSSSPPSGQNNSTSWFSW